MKTRLAVAPFGFASAFLLVWRVYSGFNGGVTTHATLLQVNGWRVILPVLFPVFPAFLPLVFRKQPLRIGAAVVMLAFGFICRFTIGLFYSPTLSPCCWPPAQAIPRNTGTLLAKRRCGLPGAPESVMHDTQMASAPLLSPRAMS